MNAARIVSLVPSTTETLLALGADVVACTRFCEQPQLVHVGGTKNPDIDAIVALEPDIVVLDREENRVEDHDELVRRGVPVLVSDVRTRRWGAGARGRAVRPLRSDPTRLVRRGRPRGGGVGTSDGVRADLAAAVDVDQRAHVRWLGAGPDRCRPRDVGGRGGVSGGGTRRGRRPDLVLVPSEPYDFTEAHVDELRGAFPEARVVRVDGQDLFWWGIRTPDAIRRLARVLDPSSAVGGDDVPALGE